MQVMQAQAIEIENPFFEAREKYNKIEAILMSEKMLSKEHSEVESILKQEGFELLRIMMQNHLNLRAEEEMPIEVVNSNEIKMTRVKSTERYLETIFGKVVVRRKGYSREEIASLHPLDAQLNLSPELYSHGVRELVAQQAAKESFDEVVKTVAEHSGAKVAKRQVQQLAQRASIDFDDFYKQNAVGQDDVGQTSEILVITTDGKGVVMHHQDLREATRKAAQAHNPKMDKRLSRGEKRNAKRMATVASVYTIKPHIRTPEQIIGQLHPIHQAQTKRPKPEQKRVWASLEKSTKQVIGAAFEEGVGRDSQHTKKWVAVVDGNEHQLDLLEIFALQYSITLTIIIDFIHVLEYLWHAAYVFNEKESTQAQEWVSERLLEILLGRSSEVAAGILHCAMLLELTSKQREAADDCANYLVKYAPYLHYDKYLAQGLPIASGVIEGACRHLVKDRMDLTGARWRLKSAEAILKLRSLRSSGDFEQYWQFHLQMELKRNHKIKYADGLVPVYKPLQSSHLHLLR